MCTAIQSKRVALLRLRVGTAMVVARQVETTREYTRCVR